MYYVLIIYKHYKTWNNNNNNNNKLFMKYNSINNQLDATINIY